MKSASKKTRTDRMLYCALPAAPAAFFVTSLRSAAAFCIAFALITAASGVFGTLIPRRVPFSVRIVLYSVIGGLVYIPAAIFAWKLFPDISGGIWFVMPAFAYSLTAARDCFFPEKHRLKALFLQILTTVCLVFLMSILREFLGSGTIWNHDLIAAPPLPFLLTPSGGLILLLMLSLLLPAAKQEKGASDAAHN